MSETLDLETERTKLERYLIKHGRQELVNELSRLNRKELEGRLLGQAKHYDEIIDAKAKAADSPQVKDAKDVIRMHNATYREQMQANNKISRFINLLMKDKA